MSTVRTRGGRASRIKHAKSAKSAARDRRGDPRGRRPRRAAAPREADGTGWWQAMRLDPGVLLAALPLVGLGILMSYSTTAALALDARLPPLFAKHLAALAAGCIACGLCAMVPLRAWQRLALPLWLTGVVLLAATALFGVEVNGAQRWLALPGVGFRFQPVEFAKLATLIAVASVVAVGDGRRPLDTRRAAVAAAVAGAPTVLLLMQPDFGNAVIVATLTALLVFAAGFPLRHLVLPGLAGVGALTAYIAMNPYAQRRVTGFLRPWDDPLGAGFQLVQSFAAFGNGGLTGAGMGAGRQKLYYLPEGHTDFVLALVAEELGLVGVLFVLGAFAALWMAGTRVAQGSPERFGVLLGLAMTSLLCVPGAVNAAVVMGLVPTKGLTLPFLSYGGTSMVASCAVLGILLGVGRNAQRQGPARRARRARTGTRTQAIAWR